MTKREFTQEAVLRLLTCMQPITEVVATAKLIADELYADDFIEQKRIHLSGEPIAVLLKELTIMENQEVKEKKIKFPGCSVCRHGYATKLSNAATYYSIKTVQDLLDFKRTEFLKIRNVGKAVAEAIDKALERRYGIETW